MAKECEEKKVTLPLEAVKKDGGINPECGEKTILLIPDELREPVPEGLPVTHPLQTPGGIPVYSHEQVAQCDKEAGQYGEDVVIPERRLERKVFFSVVLSISDEVLDHIARHRQELAISNLFHRGELDAKRLAELTTMKVREAEELLAALQAVQDTLDEQVYQMALSQLSCYYLNRPQTAVCEDPNVLRPEEYEGAVYEVTVEAGKFKSYYSQEDADNKALEYAQSLLNCFYGNPEFTALCEERPDRPATWMEPVPNDLSEIYPGRGLRVGTVVVPKNKFTSYLSQEDALRKAQQWGYAQLVCWYPNEQVETECEDPDARNEFVDPLVSPRAEADIDSQLFGQHVLIPVGFFISELSQAAATEEAQMFAENLLRCCFINDELWARCQPEEVLARDGLKYTIQPKQVENWEIYVPRGKFSSCRSKQEANDFASQSIEGMLVCLYCNVRVMPECVPDWVREGIVAGLITLPLTGDVITDGKNSVAMSQLPPEATIGIEGDQVCLTDAQRAQYLAESLAVVPASHGSDWCTCYNEEVIVGCVSPDPASGQEEAQEGRAFYEDGEPYNYFYLLPYGTNISKTMSYPRQGSYIKFGSGLFTYNCAGMLDNPEDKEHGAAAVTHLLMQLAKAMLHCYVENPEATGQCGPEGENALDAATWHFGLGKDEGTQLTTWSNSSTNLITFPRGILFRELPLDFPLQAYDKFMQELMDEARNMVQATIICMYFNEEKHGVCEDQSYTEVLDHSEDVPRIETTLRHNIKQANLAIVPRGTIIADSASEADRIAEELADGIAACDIDTEATYQVFTPEIPSYGGWQSWWTTDDDYYSTPPDDIPIPPPHGDEHYSSSPAPEPTPRPAETDECCIWMSEGLGCPNLTKCYKMAHDYLWGCFCIRSGRTIFNYANNSSTLKTYKESYVKQCNVLRSRIEEIKEKIETLRKLKQA